MIRFRKGKRVNWAGITLTDESYREVIGHPEYTLETGNNGFGSSWALYKTGKFVRSFRDLKDAREYLTNLLEPNKGGTI